MTLALTRKEHDILIDKMPEWMASTFAKLKKRWFIGGCFVYGVDEEEGRKVLEFLNKK